MSCKDGEKGGNIKNNGNLALLGATEELGLENRRADLNSTGMADLLSFFPTSKMSRKKIALPNYHFPILPLIPFFSSVMRLTAFLELVDTP